jgi:DNA-binding MarR family transcriptional regulator
VPAERTDRTDRTERAQRTERTDRPDTGTPTADDLTAAARAIAFAQRRLERALDDLTIPQFRVLALVATSPERASRIAERAAVSRPSLTGLLDGLEARGWVTRADVEGDRRGVLLTVTPAGNRMLADGERAIAGALGDLLDHAAADDRDRIVDGLVALGDLLRSSHLRRHGPSSGNDATRPPAHAAAAR